jgi:pimeloyl-ACP methyl ester carboxylesterase
MKTEPIQATGADGLTLRGEIVRGDERWVVLVHDAGEDIDAWRALRPSFAARGWTVLALDLRGHGGSEGEWNAGDATSDVDLAVRLARRLGARHVSVTAAGLGAIVTLGAVRHALADPSRALPDSLVLLSPGPLDATDPMDLRGDGLPKLVFFGAKDPLRGDAEALTRASIGWTVAVSIATEARGTGLLGEWSAVVADKMGSFLTEQASLQGLGLTRWEAEQRGPT